MKDLPFMYPFAVSLPAVYESELSFYEVINNLYNYVKGTMKPVIDEMEEKVNIEFPQIKQEFLSIKTTVNQLLNAVETLNTKYNDHETRIDVIERWKTNTAVALQNLQLKVGHLETSLNNLSDDYSQFKISTTNDISTLKLWKVNIDSWKSSINEWKETTDSLVNRHTLDIANNSQRISDIEQGNKYITFNNFMGTNINIGNLLSEEGITSWSDIIGKTITVSILFTSLSCDAGAFPSLSGEGVPSSSIMKTVQLTPLSNKSLSVEISPFITENGVVLINYKAHFNTSASAVYGGIIFTSLNGNEEIDLILDLAGFNPATTGQVYITMR